MTRAYNINVNKKTERPIEDLVESLSLRYPDSVNVNIIAGDDSTKFKLTKKGSGYAEAKETRKTSLSKLITEKLLAGEPIRKSITSSIGEKTKSRFVGIKEKFDPLNIARAMTGGSSLAPALLGRMMGRSKEDIEYFAKQNKGTSSKRRQRATQKDPFTTNIGPGRLLPLRKDDSVADITAKLYNLLQKIHERKVKEQESLASMSIKKKAKDDAAHKEMLLALRGVSGKGAGGAGGGAGSTEDDSNGWLGAAVGGWAAWKLMRGGWRALRGLTKTIPEKIANKIWDKGKSTVSKISEGRKGIRVGKGMTANKSQNLRQVLSNREIQKLQKQGIKWDAGTQRFKDIKTNKFVSSEKVANAIGKKVPGLTATKVTRASKVLSGAKGVLSFLKKVPLLSTLAAGALALKDISDAIEAREQGSINDDQLHKTVTGIVGGLLGGVAGAEVGATLGAAIGSVVPVAGTFAGGLVGGVGGFFLGEAGGKYVAEKLYDYMSNNPEAEPKDTAQQIPKVESPSESGVSNESQNNRTVRGSGVSQSMKVSGQDKTSQLPTTPQLDQRLQSTTKENNNIKLSALSDTGVSSDGGTVGVVNQSSVNTVNGKNNVRVAHSHVRNPEPSLKRSNYDSAVVV